MHILIINENDFNIKSCLEIFYCEKNVKVVHPNCIDGFRRAKHLSASVRNMAAYLKWLANVPIRLSYTI